MPVKSNIQRAADGRFKVSKTPLERFIGLCRFEPETGCVLWAGATILGGGGYRLYGRFYCSQLRKMVLAHRWSAQHIYNIHLDSTLEVDHCCPHTGCTPNTLCVRHVQATPPQINRELRYLRLSVGLDYEPELLDTCEHNNIPYYEPPSWWPRHKNTDAPF